MKGLLYAETLTGAPAIADWLGQADATSRLVLDNYKGEDEPALVNAMIR